MAVVLLSQMEPTNASDGSSAKAELAGTWNFAIDRDDIGIAERWFASTLPDQIDLPGILQSQGYGNEITTDTPWVLGLGGEWWKLQSPELRQAFSQPGRVEVPFLSQPIRHYLGAAWYQRVIHTPSDWQGQRVELFLERPHWQSTVWIDDQEIDTQRSLVAPHRFELGILSPGSHRLTVRLDNRMIVSDPKGNNGHTPDAHAVSDALGATWNGIAGSIELRATPPVWLADVQAFPNVEDKTVRLAIAIGNLTGEAGTGVVSVAGVQKQVDWQHDGGQANVEVVLKPNASTWSEYAPNLQQLQVLLESPVGTDSQQVTFGFREITWQGTTPLINGREVNFRTTHFGLDFPLTGYPATDVESWKQIIRRCQEFGLNGIRFHSCCPPEAAFTAADELGFYLQPECGLWSPFYPDGVFTKFLEEETALLLRAYGNHPSFVMFSPSNEPSGRYTQVTPEWASRWYQRDPRRLYAAGTGWNRPEQVFGGPQFAGLVRFGKGELRNESGWFGKDFRTALEGVEIPVLAHEIGQWCAYPDFDVIDKFTGYMQPSNYRIFRYIAERNGVADLNKPFAEASGKFQLACYKEELEANLRTPGLAGHQMLDIRDYLGQGTALIGVLDAFWDPKSYVTAEQFRRFHSQTVPLVRLHQRIFQTNDTLECDAELYHFGEQTLNGAQPYWKVMDAGGNVLAAGQWEARDIARGKCQPLGKVKCQLESLPAPATYRLVVGLEGTSIENDWNFWLYPESQPTTESKEVLLTSRWSEAKAELAQGGTVLFNPGERDLPESQSPRMRRTPVFWNIQMTVRPPRNPLPRFDAMLGMLCEAEHPALASFPTESHCDWQWTSIVNGVRSVNLTHAPQDLQPIVYAIDDWNRNWRLGVIFECRVEHGRLLVCSIPLDRQSPVTEQLRESLLQYAAGEAALPMATLTPQQADALWTANIAEAEAPGERTFDPDLDDGSGGNKKP
ncbi:Beta-glucuronidase [Aeoliella mucimassa]|uniref:Beta-glucuronidase n=2 Tax=Aeoliella mucimassa TaxID=2527972 RepID=A0A518ASA4_9BACT|nr:Beta-glucuronidase [Aeoliella mucimassa]